MNGGKIGILLVAFSLLFLTSFEKAIAGPLQDIKMRGRLIAGVNIDFPPCGFLGEKEEKKGLDVDIAKILAKEIFGKENVEFVVVDGKNRIALLKSGKIDVIVASMSITEKRRKEIDFSVPYFISGHLILVPMHSKITKYQDLAGLKIATIRDSTGDCTIGELVPTAERLWFPSNSDALQALKDGRVEAFVQDDGLITYLEQKNPHLRIAGLQPFHPTAYGLGVRKSDKEWLGFVNSILTKMEETGEYHKLLDKWFGRVRGLFLYSLLETKGKKSMRDLIKLLKE